MIKTTFEMDQEELEKMVTNVLKLKGLRPADVDKPIQWKHRPRLRVVVAAEADPEAIAHQKALATSEATQPPQPREDVQEPLDPDMFPDGTDMDELSRQTARLPGESPTRSKKGNKRGGGER